MADIKLTCEETPLRWPASVAVTDLKACTSCALHLFSPQPGSLQILTRRQGGAGDGVNIEESVSTGADYRGQRYALDEVIFHTPGLHVFPGQTDVYPAEYHIHMRTFSAPLRTFTLVIPVSHLVDGPGQDYFAAMAAKPDPNAIRPTLSTLLTPGTQIVQYQGPDIRGRTADAPNGGGDQCASEEMRQFLLVLQVAHIRAMDLERIPREGSLSTDPRNLPAPGVTPSQVVAKDRLIRIATLATPGIAAAVAAAEPPPPPPASTDMECQPIKVVNGRDVVDISGKSVDLLTLLGLDASGGSGSGSIALNPSINWGTSLTMFLGMLLGLLFADWIFGKLWLYFFEVGDGRVTAWEKLKIIAFLAIASSAAASPSTVLSKFGIQQQS
jgi:hypothetical protein